MGEASGDARCSSCLCSTPPLYVAYHPTDEREDFIHAFKGTPCDIAGSRLTGVSVAGLSLETSRVQQESVQPHNMLCQALFYICWGASHVLSLLCFLTPLQHTPLASSSMRLYVDSDQLFNLPVPSI